MITDGVHTENTERNGGPQADFVGEREASEFKRNVNGCPQADSPDFITILRYQIAHVDNQ